MECVLVRPAATVVCVCVALVFPQLMLLMVGGIGAFVFAALTQSSRLLAYCDVCVLKMREIFRFQAVD